MLSGTTDDDLRQSKVLIVDDDPWHVELVARVLEWAGFANVTAVDRGESALQSLACSQTDLIMLDTALKDMSGESVMKAVQTRSDAEFLPILVLTADSSRESRISALRNGACDFIAKPGDPTEILLRTTTFLKVRHLHRALMAESARLEKVVEERLREVEQAQIEAHQRLAVVAEYRDDKTGQHTIRVGETAALTALELGWSEEEARVLRLAAQLHDLGKVGVPDSIFVKPGKLTEEEFESMKKHTTIGARLLTGGRTRIIQLAEVIALSHHEKWNGTGYPKGLAGTNIPIEGRIVAVADVFDALTHERVYKKAFPFQMAIDMITKDAGSHFDPEVVKAFVKVAHRPGFEIYYEAVPSGALDIATAA